MSQGHERQNDSKVAGVWKVKEFILGYLKCKTLAN